MLAWLVWPAGAQHVQFQVYGQEQGLENLVARGIATDEQGFLWVATEAGLYRWDGSKFMHVGAEAGATEETIARMFRSSTGHLWVSSEHGLFYESEGKFGQVVAGAPAPNIGARGTIAELDEGEIAYISGDRLISVRQRRNANGNMEWAAEEFAQAHAGFPNSVQVNGLVQTRAGIWLGCDAGLCKWQAGRLTQLGEGQGVPKDSYNTLFAMRSGEVWARGRKHLSHLAPDSSQWRDAAGAFGTGVLDCTFPFLAEDGQGRLMINLVKKIGILEGSRWQFFGEGQGLPAAMVSSIFVDARGSVWLGVRGAGLFRWKGYGLWKSYTQAEGLPNNALWELTPDGAGGLVAGTDAGVAYLPAGASRFARLAGTEEVRRMVYATARTADGSLWFTSDSTLYRKRAGAGGLEHFALPGLSPELREAGADLWVATVKGLYVVHGGQPNSRPELFAPLGARPIRRIATGNNGEVWVSASDGVYRLDASRGTATQVLAGGPALDVYSIAVDQEGTLWGGVDQKGLFRAHIEGDRVQRMDWVARPLLHSRVISQVIVDRRGWVWVSGDGGLDVLHDGRWSLLNEKSGLVWNDTDEGSFLEAEDGSIWVGTSGGLSHLLEPEKALETRMHSVRILSVTVGGREIPAVSPMRIPPGKGIIEIRVGTTEHESEPFAQLMYSAPGFLDGWTLLGESMVRMPQSVPRHATLYFQIFDESRTPVSDQAMLEVVVQPPWWRGNAAMALYVLAAVGLVVLGWHLRTRQMRERQRQLQELVATRTNELAEKNRVLETMQEVLEYKATHDALTGLHNRSALLDQLKREMPRCRRENRPLVASILDLDHFKRINDNFGHSVGDEVLVEMSGRLAAALRAYDASGRYGGEEFILLLPGLDPSEAEHRLNQIREEISAQPCYVNGEPMRVTASFGYAVLGEEDTAPSLLARADKALYRAKAEGRNRVCFGAEEREQETAGASEGREGCAS